MTTIPRSIVTTCVFILAATLVKAQVGIGTNSPSASAQLEISSTSKGLLLPRLTTTQVNSITDPAAGLLVFNTTTNKFVGYAGVTASGTISNTNIVGGGAYIALANQNMMMSTSVVDDGQTFPISNAIKLNSIAIWFVTFNGGPGNIKVSVYSGNIPGSGVLLGSKTQSVSSTGQNVFTFDSPIWLSPGNYYFLIHAETLGINAGLGYCSSQYSTGSFFQGQSQNGGQFTYTTNNTNSLYFIFNFNSPQWENLN